MPAGDVIGDPGRIAAMTAVLPVAQANSAAMDRLAELAATIMDAPVGLVSLISDRHQYLVGLTGAGEPLDTERRIGVDEGFCRATLFSGRPLYIEDAAEDPLFVEHHSYVTLGFVAYAGAPLRDSDGQLIGTVCVADTRPRRWRQVDRRALLALAESVVSELSMHQDIGRRQRLLDAFDRAPAGIAVTRGPRHVLEFHNAMYRQVFGDLPLEVPGRAAMRRLPDEFFARMDSVLATGETYTATDAPITLVWPDEQQPRARFFDLSCSAIGRGDVERGAGFRGLLIVSVEVTERVQAHRALQRHASRQELLTNASAALNRNLDPAAELRALARVVVPELADISTVHRLAHPVPPGRTPPLPVITDRVACAAVPEIVPLPIARGLRWEGDGDPVTDAIRLGGLLRRPIFMPQPPTWAERAGAGPTVRSGLHHMVFAPVVVDGLVVAVVFFGMGEHRRLWDDEELATLSEIARHAGVALGHGLTYQQTRESALVLQRSLLTEPPDVDGLTICARYQPAGRDEVGGDWYDAFERRDGELALVIGDVVGHDITAAAAMAQLRATLRGIALDRGGGPAAALDRLDTINTRLRITPFATLAHAHLGRSGDAWLLRWATAGHPPPVLVQPGAAPQLLTEQATGAALMCATTAERTDGEIVLPSGSTLLLYTDGLVERRNTDLAENIDAVAAHATQLADRPLDELCDELLSTAPTSDDVALLGIRVR